ncbi:hypothetical protein L873DRAFT_756724 [Choiromyces venosus 120613-1]|uniref:Uncharacterized protein n=1 Tax=Choiromyces venosus 120613-1 TaxID=1336337 RepID=A0A3N4JUV6_9PEZI|nr:hypothetical protein L873DRAFT_756724 [Choiromyces venosus 120613-1]
MGVVRRDITSGWNDFTTSFSSFNKCMEKSYCKIPFIVICVVGGLIAFSILWCFLRCCFCGYQCCACCCGGCGGCGKRREKKVTIDISNPPPLVTREPPVPEPPKYAYFDAHNDDALPIMPTLENNTKHIAVEVKVEEHELTPMKGVGHERSLTPATQEYEYERRVPTPLRALRQPNERIPTPVGGYQRGAHGDRSVAFRSPSPASAYSPTVPPVAAGYPESGAYHQGGRRDQYAGHNAGSDDYHLQQPQPQWGNGASRNTVQNAYGDYEANPYQGPLRPRQQQQQPAQDIYYDQRKPPQEWTAV